MVANSEAKIYCRGTKGIKTKTPRWGVLFLDYLSDARDLNCVRTLRALCNFKAHLVAFAKLVERRADDLIRVKEKILVLSFDRNETKTLVCKTCNNSFLH